MYSPPKKIPIFATANETLTSNDQTAMNAPLRTYRPPAMPFANLHISQFANSTYNSSPITHNSLGYRLKKRTEFQQGSGIGDPNDFDAILKKQYEQVGADSYSVGKTVIRYGDSPCIALHVAVYMGKDNLGKEYVFTKNGWHLPPGISTVQSMLECGGYGYNYSIGNCNDRTCEGNGYYNRKK